MGLLRGRRREGVVTGKEQLGTAYVEEAKSLSTSYSFLELFCSSYSVACVRVCIILFLYIFDEKKFIII